MASELQRQPAEAAPTRRHLLASTAKAGLALLLAGLPQGWSGTVYAADGPEVSQVRIGIIALTDCSSIVMAYELGFFKKYGIAATISKEASWAVIRDRLSLGENQASHLLLGMAYASTMGLLGSPVKPMIIPFYLHRNGQAITLKKEFLASGIKTPQALKARADAAKKAGTPDLCHDLSRRHPCHVDALLAGLRGHQPGRIGNSNSLFHHLRAHPPCLPAVLPLGPALPGAPPPPHPRSAASPCGPAWCGMRDCRRYAASRGSWENAGRAPC
jgi:hypothetical protein